MHNFQESLKKSHDAEDMPFWRTCYEKAFPTMQEMVNHRADGEHQRAGIDRSIILESSKQVLVDEKVRYRNANGKVYADIALEYLSNAERNVAGWVCKPILCDYIAYAIAPLGKCYLLPVIQMQSAWEHNKDRWLGGDYFIANAKNGGAYPYTTKSVCVPVKEVFKQINQCFRVSFDPFES